MDLNKIENIHTAAFHSISCPLQYKLSFESCKNTTVSIAIVHSAACISGIIKNASLFLLFFFKGQIINNASILW